MKAGRQSPKRNVSEDGLLEPDFVGRQFGTNKIVSRKVDGKYSRLKVEVKCTSCNHVFMNNLNNMKRRPNTRACPNCNGRKPVKVPSWLYKRCQAQKDRCQNPKNSHFARYGGRGIEFRFSGVNEAAHWIAENIGISDRSLELDRIDNNGHYEPGNIRWAHPVLNMNNSSISKGNREKFMSFRESNPHVRYADSTLMKLIGIMTEEDILKRWEAPSFKPKGKYGTFSAQGLYRDLPQTEG